MSISLPTSTSLRGSPRRQCSICNTEKAKVIHAYLSAGRKPHWIEGQMRALGHPIKAETIRKHLDICLNGHVENSVLIEAADSPKPVSDDPDFAQAIRAEAQRLLAAGQLRVTAAHGLKAQELLDRRAERQADRELMVQLAGLLAGARRGPPADLIEGDWAEVSVEPVLLDG